MKHLSISRTLYHSPRLRLSIDSARFLHIESEGLNPEILFAPAVMDVTAVAGSESNGYVHISGPFQGTSRRGQRRNVRNVGPMSLHEVQEVVEVLKHELELPVAPIEVTHDDLVNQPERYRDRVIRSRGLWSRRDGISVFASAWLVVPDEWNTYGEFEDGVDAVTVDVVGLWTVRPEGRDERVGLSTMFDAYLLEALSELSLPATPRSRLRQYAIAYA